VEEIRLEEEEEEKEKKKEEEEEEEEEGDKCHFKPFRLLDQGPSPPT